MNNKKQLYKQKHQEKLSLLYTGKVGEKTLPPKSKLSPKDQTKPVAKARCISKGQLHNLRERFHYGRYTIDEWNAFIEKSFKQEWTELFQDNIMSFTENTPQIDIDYWMMFKWATLLKMDDKTPLKEWERLIEKYKIMQLYAKHIFLPNDVTRFGVSLCVKVKYDLKDEVLKKKLMEHEDGFIPTMLEKYVKNTKHIKLCHYTKHIPHLLKEHSKYQPDNWKEVKKTKSWYGKSRLKK